MTHLLTTNNGGIIKWIMSLIDPNLPYQSWISGLDSLLSVILAIGTILGVIWAFVQYGGNALAFLGKPYLAYRRNVDLYYGKDLRKTVFRYFIQTRGQDIDPCDQDEICDDNGNSISKPLIPFFCDTAFSDDSRGKYYIVLADSGMGKSTFMVSLYRSYLLGFKIKSKKNIVLLPLTLSNCLEKIKKTPDKENTILLLDALDENKNAMESYYDFFKELMVVTESFNKVVITCRTQFFPNRLSEPDHAGGIQIGVGNKAIRISKKYLSPFSSEEILRYLKKRYRFNSDLRNKALNILDKVPDLMARPVILNWMDFLCDSPRRYKNTFTIYTSIIDKWIEREDLGGTADSLRQLSIDIAAYMLENQTTCMPGEKVEEIARQKNIHLRPIIARSRSLLNRNGKGEYKFAHRSFFEYLTVYGLLSKTIPIDGIHYAIGMIGVKRFLLEILLQTKSYHVDWVQDRSSQNIKFNRFPRAYKLFDLNLVLEEMAKSRHFIVSIIGNGTGFLMICRTYVMFSDVVRVPPKSKRSQMRGSMFSFPDHTQKTVYISDQLIEIEYKFVVDLSGESPLIDIDMKVASN